MNILTYRKKSGSVEIYSNIRMKITDSSGYILILRNDLFYMKLDVAVGGVDGERVVYIGMKVCRYVEIHKRKRLVGISWVRMDGW